MVQRPSRRQCWSRGAEPGEEVPECELGENGVGQQNDQPRLPLDNHQQDGRHGGDGVPGGGTPEHEDEEELGDLNAEVRPQVLHDPVGKTNGNSGRGVRHTMACGKSIRGGKASAIWSRQWQANKQLCFAPP